MLTQANKFWTWLLVSSSDPTQVALTIKGYVSSIIPVALILIHNPNLSTLPDQVYSIVVAALTLVSGIATLYGLFLKVIRTIQGKNMALQAYASRVGASH